MKQAILYIFFLINSCATFAQQKTIDSLQQVIETGDQKQQVDALTSLANLVVDDSPEQAKSYAQQAIQLATDINYKPGLGDAYNRIGIAYDISGMYDTSIYFYQKALVIYNDIKNYRGRGSALNNLGLIYWNMADYDKALTYFFEALKDFELIKHDRFTANALNNIGLVYQDVKKYKDALIYHLKAKAVYEKINDLYLRGAVYNNLGNVYGYLNNLDSAEYYYKYDIRMQTDAEDDYGLSIAYNGYASLLLEKKYYDSALSYFDKSLILKVSLNEVIGQAIIMLNIADIYRIKKDEKQQLEYLLKAKALAEKNDLKKQLISVYNDLANFYEEKDPKLSYSFYKKYSEVKDSVFNENSNRQITELNTKYETGKKELQLKEQDLIITRKNFFIGGISIAVLLLSLLGFSYYRRYKLKQDKKLQSEVIRQQDLATKAIIEAEENERKRIAAELHDGIGQMMSAAKMNLSVFENELPFTSIEQKNSFENVINLVDESCKEIRSVSHQMMPNALLKSGLASAVKEFIDKIDSRIIKVTLYTEGLNERIDSNTETVLYRVIQECVNNVLKHAEANHLDISLIKDAEGIAVTIEDNGKGFDVSNKDRSDGIGLKNILSRINYLKGTIDYDSEPNKGTLVAIHVPN